MTYADTMDRLYNAAQNAITIAENTDGAPADALRKILADIDSVLSCGLTVVDFKDMEALYRGARQAGLTK